MKKCIIYLSIFIILLVFCIKIILSISQYKNILVIETHSPVSEKQLNSLKHYQNETGNFSSINVVNYPEVSVKTKWETISDMDICMVNDTYIQFHKIKLLHGSFLLKKNALLSYNPIILNSNTAINYFSKTNCIGETLYIDEIPYHVAGVYKSKRSLISFLSGTMKNPAFIALTAGFRINKPIVITLRLRDRTSSIYDNIILEDFNRILGDNCKLANVDVKTRMLLSNAYLLFFVLLFIVLCFFCKMMIALYKVFYDYFKRCSENQFIFDCVKACKAQLAALVLPSVFVILAFVTLANKLGTYLYINPDLIPSSLLNIDDFTSKLYNYIKAENSIGNTLCYINILKIYNLHFICCTPIMIYAFYKLSSFIFIYLNKYILNLYKRLL